MSFNWKSFILGLLAMLALVGAVTTAVWAFTSRQNIRGGKQAVFLTNGQVYFGTITGQTKDEIKLTGIYYLQSDKNGSEEPKDDVSLIKLGNELHGPEDVMYINRQHVLFIEQLKPDSKVVQAMK